jgi:hypothetical protein
VLAGTAYYVDCTDAGTNSGTFANPWQTIGDITGLGTGDDLYFKEGTTCKQDNGSLDTHLDITWDGTSGDRAIIGCYDGENDFECDGTLPILDGDGVEPTETANNNVGIIDKQDDGHDYVTVKDIQIYDSNESGIYFVDVENVIFDNLTVSSQNDEGRINLGVLGNYNADAEGANVKVYRNTVYGGYEGLGLYRNANNSEVYNNVIYDCVMGIYIASGATDNEVHHNLMYETSSTTESYMHGIQMGCEDELGSTNFCQSLKGNECLSGNSVYANLIAGVGVHSGVGQCFRAYNNCTGTDDQALGGAPFNYSNNKFYNNTCIDSGEYELRIYCEQENTECNSGHDVSGNEVKNNIFWTKNNEGTETRHDDHYGWSFSKNWYDTLPDSHSDADSPSYEAIIGGTVPCAAINTLCTAADTPFDCCTGNGAGNCDFNALDVGEVNGQEFALVQGFAGLVGGDTTLGDAYDDGFDNNTDQIANTDFTASPIAVQLQDRDEDGATWSIGAWEWAEPPVGVPNNASMGGS